MLPALPKHGGDRNRTSPFAFTGNKFEFRALGSSQSLALPNTVLNTIVAEAIDDLADKLEADGAGEDAVLEVVRDAYAANKQIVFDGDNYSEEWHKEAEERGLFNLKQTPDALPWLINEQTVEVFSRYDVLSERELESRYEVFVEQYVTNLNIEAETAADMARTLLLPAALQYMALLDDAEGGAGVERLTDGDHRADRRVRRDDLRARGGQRRPPRDGGRPRGREVRAVDGHPGDGGGPRGRRPARADRPRLALAAAEVRGDPVHQVALNGPVCR